MAQGFWTKEKREYDALSLAIEQTLAKTACGENTPDDFTVRIEKQRGGKYGLSFWAMDVASGDGLVTEGDKQWGDEMTESGKASEANFRRFLHTHNVESTVPVSGHPQVGRELFLFKSAEEIATTLNTYRQDKNLPTLDVVKLMAGGAGHAYYL